MQGIPVRANGDPVRRTFVIAGSYTQFTNWCMYSRVNPRSRLVKYASGPCCMRGYSDFDVVFTGTYQYHRDIRLIREDLLHYSAVGEIKHTYDQYESCEIEPDVID